MENLSPPPSVALTYANRADLKAIPEIDLNKNIPFKYEEYSSSGFVRFFQKMADFFSTSTDRLKVGDKTVRVQRSEIQKFIFDKLQKIHASKLPEKEASVGAKKQSTDQEIAQAAVAILREKQQLDAKNSKQLLECYNKIVLDENRERSAKFTHIFEESSGITNARQMIENKKNPTKNQE